jgi:outer membrane lipopolysaccharide assembly protein LptE/RlpB
MNQINKKILILLSVLLITGCGFKVVDKTNLKNIYIKKINTQGDKRLSFKIKNNLYVNANNKQGVPISLNIITKKTKSIKEKNLKNEITKYQITINSEIKLNIKTTFSIDVAGDYAVNKNYSKTLDNRKKLEDRLINNISEKIFKEINIRLNDI